MNLIKKEQAQIIKNSNTSFLLEYSNNIESKDLDFCINTITGRYPTSGFCSNEECSEICYVLEGQGTINTKNETHDFKQGDVIYIKKKDVYYWNGNCKIIMVCSPAWYKEQCKIFTR